MTLSCRCRVQPRCTRQPGQARASGQWLRKCGFWTSTPRRQIIEAIVYLDRTGCAWRYLPADFPLWRTVYGYFAAWRDNGVLTQLHDRLHDQARAAAGRDLKPTAAVIDSQSVKAADTVPKASRGWDNAKKVNGRKRHIAVDTMGLLLAIAVTAASVPNEPAMSFERS